MRPGSWLIWLPFVMLPSLLAAQTQQATPAACLGDLSTYEGRTVLRVEVTSPFSFMPAAKKLLDGAAATLPLHAGASFTAKSYSEGSADLTKYVRARLPAGLTAVQLVVTHGAIEDCTATTVAVHYTVFTMIVPRTSGNLLEVATAMIERPSVTGGDLGTAGRLKLMPALNYNHTRGAFGGLDLDEAIPLRVFDHLDATPLVSSNSVSGHAALTGTSATAKKYLNRLDWQLSSQYYDVPATTASLTKAILAVSAFGSTKELDAHTTLHYGASLGGGHVQDGFQDGGNSSYGESKLAAGAEVRWGQSNLSASYGLEIGTTFTQGVSPFAKHIVDLRYASNITPLPAYLRHGGGKDDRKDYIGITHKPLSLEVQFGAGFLSRPVQIPNVERFVGGNQADRSFIDGQTWKMRDEPYIRSIPENKFGLVSGPNMIGGNQFYSTNLTVGKAIYGRPLVPKDLGDQTFLDNLDGGIKSAKGLLSDEYFSKDPRVSSNAARVKEILERLGALQAQLQALPTPLTRVPAIAAALGALNHELSTSIRTGNAIATQGKNIEMGIFLNTQLPLVDTELVKLKSATTLAGDTSTASALQSSKDALSQVATTLRQSWDSPAAAAAITAARTAADAHADTDFAPAETVLNSLLYRLNVYSIAPVGIFDAAHISSTQDGTRYGVGGGVRLSIVNVNFTSGYAYNPTRSSGESRGAFFFALDFTDLFH